ELAREPLPARLRPQLGPSRRRILEKLGSSISCHQTESRQAEDQGHRDTDLEAHGLPPAGMPVFCQGSAVERVRVGVMIRHSAALLALLLALVLLWAPLPFGGVTPWAEALQA